MKISGEKKKKKKKKKKISAGGKLARQRGRKWESTRENKRGKRKRKRNHGRSYSSVKRFWDILRNQVSFPHFRKKESHVHCGIPALPWKIRNNLLNDISDRRRPRFQPKQPCGSLSGGFGGQSKGYFSRHNKSLLI